MIGILIVAHGTLADSLVGCAVHVLGARPEQLAAIDFSGQVDTEERLASLKAQLDALDTGEGVLVLTDLFGATPSNTLCRVLVPGRVEAVAGVNLPMLLKALTYRASLGLPALVTRVEQGGREGIQHISETLCHAATGR